jgi:hypothetical protein
MAKEVKAKDCRYISEIKEAINTIAIKCSHFKIGKTGETIEERGNQPDYQKYDSIQCLYTDISDEFISMLEKIFIDDFIDHPNNDNEKDGGQSMNDNMTESSEYHLYIVWK